jgi:predicted lipoprotein with Yx(FWY)xxD motif
VGAAAPVVIQPSPKAPHGFTVQRTRLGPLYADSQGMTVYTFKCELPSPGTRTGETYNCDGWNSDLAHREQYCPDVDRCGEIWRPVLAPTDTKVHGGVWSVAIIPDPVRFPLRWKPAGSDLGKTTDEVKVWTYKGQPVYTLTEDRRPGDIWMRSALLPSRWQVVYAGEPEWR